MLHANNIFLRKCCLCTTIHYLCNQNKRLRKKLQVFREATHTRKALQLVMITTYGIRQNAHSGIVQTQVKMDDLFVKEA